MPRVADVGFGPDFPEHYRASIAVVRAKLLEEPALFAEAAEWLRKTWTKAEVERALKWEAVERRKRARGTPTAPGPRPRVPAQPFRLPGDKLRADRLEHALKWLLGQNNGAGIHRLLGGNQSDEVLRQNALKAILVAVCVIDPAADEWLGTVTPLALTSWKPSKPKGKPSIKGRSDVCRVFSREAIKLMEEAISVLGWEVPALSASSAVDDQKWNVPPEVRALVRAKMREIVFSTQAEDAVRVAAGLTLLQSLGAEALPGRRELCNPFEHAETMEVWRTLGPSLERLAILAESRGIDSTPLRELQCCRTFDQLDQLELLVERLDVIVQAKGSGGLGEEERPKGKGQTNTTDTEFAHAPDFTWVIWCGRRFTFGKGLKAECVRHLWEAWEAAGRRDGCGMSEKTLGEKAGSENDDFRLSHILRAHPAMETMIRRSGKGAYGLYRLDSRKNPGS